MEEKKQRIAERKMAEATTEATTSKTEAGTPEQPPKELKIEVHATAVHHAEKLEPKVAHVQSHEFSHSQAVRL